MIHLMVVMIVLALTHLLCFAMMSELKYSVKKTAAIYGITAIAFVGLVALAFGICDGDMKTAFSVSYGLTITVCFFVFCFTSTDSIDKKVFLYISYANIFCILWGIAEILTGVFWRDLSVIQESYTKNGIRTLMTIPVVFLYIKYLRPVVREIPTGRKKIWASLSLTSILFLLVFFLLISGGYKSFFPEANYILVFSIFVVIYASVLWVVFGSIQQMNSENKMKLMDQKAKYLQSELETARQTEVIAKRIKHDYRHHMQNIAAMLQNGDVKHTLEYIDKYNSDLDVMNRKEFCPNITVNAILANFYHITQNNGILFSASADTPYQTPIADTDFVAILSNLLENAVNSCRACEKPGKITVNIRSMQNKTVIVCSNSCWEKMEIENHMLKNKGVGIDSIIASARKYKGEIRYKQENGILSVCVILKA